MNTASLARHLLTYLAGLGGMLLSWHLIAPDQVEAVNKAALALITPLSVILGAIAAGLARLAITWLWKLFGIGAGERDGKKTGLWIGLVMVGATAGLCGLPSCSPAQREALQNIPIRSAIVTDYGTLGYSSKSGISVYVDRRSGK